MLRKRMDTLRNFIRCEAGFDEARIPARWGKYALVLLILNEVRGVIVAGSIAMQIWG